MGFYTTEVYFYKCDQCNKEHIDEETDELPNGWCSLQSLKVVPSKRIGFVSMEDKFYCSTKCLTHAIHDKIQCCL